MSIQSNVTMTWMELGVVSVRFRMFFMDRHRARLAGEARSTADMASINPPSTLYRFLVALEDEPNDSRIEVVMSFPLSSVAVYSPWAFGFALHSVQAGALGVRKSMVILAIATPVWEMQGWAGRQG